MSAIVPKRMAAANSTPASGSTSTVDRPRRVRVGEAVERPPVERQLAQGIIQAGYAAVVEEVTAQNAEQHRDRLQRRRLPAARFGRMPRCTRRALQRPGQPKSTISASPAIGPQFSPKSKTGRNDQHRELERAGGERRRATCRQDGTESNRRRHQPRQRALPLLFQDAAGGVEQREHEEQDGHRRRKVGKRAAVGERVVDRLARRRRGRPARDSSVQSRRPPRPLLRSRPAAHHACGIGIYTSTRSLRRRSPSSKPAGEDGRAADCADPGRLAGGPGVVHHGDERAVRRSRSALSPATNAREAGDPSSSTSAIGTFSGGADDSAECRADDGSQHQRRQQHEDQAVAVTKAGQACP